MASSQNMSSNDSDGKLEPRKKSLSISLETGHLEQFPSFAPNRHPSIKNKSKSVTDAEVNNNVLPEEDFATAIQRLKNEKSPDSLAEVRDRRAEAKKIRRDTINLIRRRTASRISNSGRSSLGVREKVGFSG